jgi:PAS domain-containing protein
VRKSPDPRSGVIRLAADGRPLDIDANALAILGVAREQFMTAPRGAFSARPLPDAESEALRAEWERAGRPELVGASTIRRGDGTEARVSFLIEEQPDGTLIAIITPLDEPTSAATKVYTAADVLREWRSAERDMAEVPAGTREHGELSGRVAELRTTYQRIVRTRHGRRPNGGR